MHERTGTTHTPASGQPARDELERLSTEAVRLMSDLGEVVLNAVDEGIYCIDAHGRTMFVNEAATRMLGYASREIVGRPQHELIHHHYADGTPFPLEACPIWSSVTDGVHQRVGGDVFWRKDGTLLPVDYTSIAIRRGRQIVAVLVTFRDVSAEQDARKQAARFAAERAARESAERAEAALRQRDERFRALVAATGQIVWTNSAEGRMEGEQSGWSGYTGQSQEEYAGFGWASAVHPDDAQPTIDAWNEAVRGRTMFVFEHRVRGKDGQYRRFAIRAVPLLNDDGSIREWVGSHTDITAQWEQARAVEQARREAELARAELLQVFDQAPAAIATTEGPAHAFRTANARYRQLVGGRDVLGKPVREAFPELDGAPFFDMLDTAYRTGEPVTGERMPAAIDRGRGLVDGFFDFVFQPLRGPDGMVSGIMIHASEVSGVR